MKKRYIWTTGLAILVVCFGVGYYFMERKMLFFIDKPVLEIHSEFHYEQYIKKIKKGDVDDVVCDDEKLDNSQLGEYEIIYTYRGQSYSMMLKVVDTTKPEIQIASSLTILVGGTVDLKEGVEINDNSGIQPELLIDSSQLDTAKAGEYLVKYIATDTSGNQETKTRTVKVLNEYGTSVQSSEKIVYLTFDDGPSQNTKKILDILERYDAKATFFVTGNGQNYNNYIKEAYEKGHTIGLHSYCHEYDIIYSSVEAYFDDLSQIEAMVKELIGVSPHYIRFPGGSSNKVSMKYHAGIMSVLTQEVVKKGYQYYDWNCGTGDAEGNHVPVETIIQNATVKEDNNIVMLAHDTDAKDTTVQALPSIIQYYQSKGYQFKAIDDESFYAHQTVNN